MTHSFYSFLEVHSQLSDFIFSSYEVIIRHGNSKHETLVILHISHHAIYTSNCMEIIANIIKIHRIHKVVLHNLVYSVYFSLLRFLGVNYLVP